MGRWRCWRSGHSRRHQAARARSLDDELPRDGIGAKTRPLRRAVLREELYFRVDEVAVLQHFLARLVVAGVAERRLDGQRLRARAWRQAVGSGRREEA